MLVSKNGDHYRWGRRFSNDRYDENRVVYMYLYIKVRFPPFFLNIFLFFIQVFINFQQFFIFGTFKTHLKNSFFFSFVIYYILIFFSSIFVDFAAN